MSSPTKIWWPSTSLKTLEGTKKKCTNKFYSPHKIVNPPEIMKNNNKLRKIIQGFSSSSSFSRLKLSYMTSFCSIRRKNKRKKTQPATPLWTHHGEAACLISWISSGFHKKPNLIDIFFLIFLMLSLWSLRLKTFHSLLAISYLPEQQFIGIITGKINTNTD